MAWILSLRRFSKMNCVPLNPGQVRSRPVESGMQQLAPESSNSLEEERDIGGREGGREGRRGREGGRVGGREKNESHSTMELRP